MKYIQFLFIFFNSSSALYANSDISCLSHYVGRNQLIYHIKNLPFSSDSRVIKKQAFEVSESMKVSDWVMTELRKKSFDFLNENSKKEIIDLDFLCLGAGPQCAAASLVLGHSKFSSLVVERSDYVAKTFAEKDFYINSSELDQLSMHQFPGGLGDLADYTSFEFAHSQQLATHIQVQQLISKVPVLFNTEVVEIKKVEDREAIKFLFKTKNGLRFRVKNILVGSGLGDIATKVSDPNYRDFFSSQYELHIKQPKQLQLVMTTDTFLVTKKLMDGESRVMTLPRRIAVIGDGDGSKIVLESLLTKSVVLHPETEIIWVGNEYKDFSDFYRSTKGFTRYLQGIFPFYEKRMITGVKGYIQSWKKNSDGSFFMTAEDVVTKKVSDFTSDMIIDSTGYVSFVPTLKQWIGASQTLKDEVGELNELDLKSTVLARRMVDSVTSKELNVYLLGASAGNLASRAELMNSPNKNPVSIFNTVPRTSSFLSYLTQTSKFPSYRGKKSSRQKVISSYEMIERIKLKLAEVN